VVQETSTTSVGPHFRSGQGSGGGSGASEWYGSGRGGRREAAPSAAIGRERKGV
jgi:hypothetical protein